METDGFQPCQYCWVPPEGWEPYEGPLPKLAAPHPECVKAMNDYTEQREKDHRAGDCDDWKCCHACWHYHRPISAGGQPCECGCPDTVPAWDPRLREEAHRGN